MKEKNISLGFLEFFILSIIAVPRQEHYGYSICNRLSEDFNYIVKIGTVYTVLRRLEGKCFVESHWTEKTKKRGGRSKRVYKLSKLGKEVLFDFNKPIKIASNNIDLCE